MVDHFCLDYLIEECPFLLVLLETNPASKKILWLAESRAASNTLTKTDTNSHEIVFENGDMELD